MEFYDWLKIGIDNGWTSDVHCYTHTGPEMTEEEIELWDDGNDPCMFIIRVWD